MARQAVPAHDVTIEPLRLDHVPDFLFLATKEGWLCERWEFDFVLKSFPQGCRVALGSGSATGFVTAVKYEKSGWVGNLLVRKDMRGLGLGRSLMTHALHALDRAGAETIWLTASPAGQPLYERLGFLPLDTIVRWRGSGGLNHGVCEPSSYSLAALVETDRAGWGDRRIELLGATAQRGFVISEADGFCTFQPAGDGLQVGPWGSRCRDNAERLLQKGLAAVEPQPSGICLDVPHANREAASILRRNGFAECGETVLMCRGSRPHYEPDNIYALATMGSMG